jgi:N-acetylneuraminic acid mutarotase/uncharacterized GH25 family protein
MLRCLLFAAIFGSAAVSYGHFIFVVPEKDGESARVVFSEGLEPDENVDMATISGTKLQARNRAGESAVLPWKAEEHAYRIDLDANETLVVYGTCECGVMSRGGSKPFLLVYHPKTVVAGTFDGKNGLGKDVPVEIIPQGKSGALSFKLIAEGKPVPDAELTVIDPEGKQTQVKTNSEGQSPTFSATGRYGVWARYFVASSGTRDGKAYEEVRHYPTLVVDVADGSNGAAVRKFAELPEATSSFGAVVCDGWLYVYGGHTAQTHAYSTEAVSGRFHRLKLADGKTWEELSGGPGLQGMNLATHGGKIYRVGGMQPRNKPKEKEDVYSLADCSVFDPATKAWSSLEPLPLPRSSHDVAVVGDRLYVIGGWNMRGSDGNDWLTNMQVLDLAKPKSAWKSIEQPFNRRALIAAVHNGKIHVLGGFDSNDEPHLQVNIFDPQSNKWTTGPDIPGHKFNGFAPAACTLDGKLYISVADGGMYRLNEAAHRWDEVARTTPRIVHRLAPHAGQILVVGGASKGGNFNLIEAVDVTGK